MADEIEYKLEDISATRVASDDIDQTFRSNSIGMIKPLLFVFLNQKKKEGKKEEREEKEKEGEGGEKKQSDVSKKKTRSLTDFPSQQTSSLPH